jgi:hypothetical protein
LAVWIPNWDLRCEKCSDSQKAFNGCEQDSVVPERWKIREWVWQRCPVKLITQETIKYLRAYNILQLGILPHQRGWLKESNKFIEAMEIINFETKRIEAENLRQMKKK